MPLAGVILVNTKKVLQISVDLVLGIIAVSSDLCQNVQETAAVNVRPVKVDHVINPNFNRGIAGIDRDRSAGIAVGVVLAGIGVSINIVIDLRVVALGEHHCTIIIKIDLVVGVRTVVQN